MLGHPFSKMSNVLRSWLWPAGVMAIPRLIVGSGVAFLGGLAYDQLAFLGSTRIEKIIILSTCEIAMVIFSDAKRRFLFATIAAPVGLVLREKLLASGGMNLLVAINIVAKVVSDELHDLTEGKSGHPEEEPSTDMSWNRKMERISAVHQLVTWYLVRRFHRAWRLGVQFLDRQKGGWPAAIGAFIGAGIWSLSGYWVLWIKLYHPWLYAAGLHYLQERPLLYAHIARTAIRNRFDRLLFNMNFGRLSSYQHRPLERSKSEIRLLNLRAANSWDVIKADLISVPISEAPPFEAISYRWSSGDEVPMLLNQQKFVVAGEVHKMLRTLRCRREDRLLWLDSICIDQKSDDEKSWQIGLMKEIYSSSKRVIGWIAVMPGVPSLPGPFSSLRALGALEEHKEKTLQLQFDGDLCLQLRAAMMSLINEFFFRTWIIQEVTLARKLILQFDREETAWEDFLRDIESFLLFYSTCASLSYYGPVVNKSMLKALDKIRTMEKFRSALMKMPDGLPLGQLLHSSADFSVTNPRDRVFGLLGLSTDDARTANPIKYGANTTDLRITINAARFVLCEESSFLLLGLAGIGFLPSELTSNLEGPSWIPRWEPPHIPLLQEFALNCNELYGTATWAPAIITGGEDSLGALQVQAIYVGKIRLLSHPWLILDEIFEANWTTMKECLQSFVMLQLLIEESFELAQYANNPVYNDVDHQNLVWRTLCHITSSLSNEQPDIAGQSFEEYVEIVKASINTITASFRAQIDRGAKGVDMDSLEGLRTSLAFKGLRHLVPMRRARLCITDNGYFGVVPAYSEEGDQIWAFLGGPNPHVLRAASNSAESKPANAHQLVGSCYIDGIMHGELENVRLESAQVNLV